jgi:hypothetical protein
MILIDGEIPIPSATELASVVRLLKPPQFRDDVIDAPLHITDEELMRGEKELTLVDGVPLCVIRTVRFRAVSFGQEDGRRKLLWIYEGRVYA